jgi:hypothetical protein
MINPLIHTTTSEVYHDHNHHLVSWKSALAGLLTALMGYLIMSALGAGIGGMTASHLISHDESGSGFATATGLWAGLSVVFSLFLGSYYAVRVSQYRTTRAGAAHGFLIASLFFLLLTTGHTIGINGEMGRLSGMMYNDGATAPGQAITAADATAIADAGWALFATFVVGLVAAVLGGRTAAHANVDRPVGELRGTIIKNEKGGIAPYLLGWFMGVPATVLFLIFMLRSC